MWGILLKMEKGIVYRGLNYVTPVEVVVTKICSGVGQIKCIECEGTGWWAYGPTEEDGPCIECKGTGKIYVGSF